MRNDKKGLLTNSVMHDAFDSVAYVEILNQSKELQNLNIQGLQALKTFGELASDVFYSLYKVRPELTLENEIAPEYILNHAQMSKLMESQSYQELREYTQLDELGAGLGSKALLDTLLKQLQQDNDLREASSKINDLIEQQSTITSDQTRQMLSGMQSKIRRAVELATEKAIAEVEEVESVIISWGLNQGEFTKLPYSKKLELLQVLRGQQRFKDMAKLVGRMRSLATGSRKARLEHRVELHSITQGNDISHVLPQELMALRRPALKLDFYRRMVEKN